MRYNIEKNGKFIKAMEPNKYWWFILVTLCIISALAKDLNYENLFLVCWGFCIYYAMYVVVWCLYAVVHAIIKHVHLKKQPKEKLDNEDI